MSWTAFCILLAIVMLLACSAGYVVAERRRRRLRDELKLEERTLELLDLVDDYLDPAPGKAVTDDQRERAVIAVHALQRASYRRAREVCEALCKDPRAVEAIVPERLT